MPNTLVRVPDVTFTPGVATIPPEPRRCVKIKTGTRIESYEETVTETYYSSTPVFLGFDDDPSMDPYGGEPVYTPVRNPDSAQQRNVTFFRTRVVDVYREECTPAVPGVPGVAPKVETDYGPDWQATARSRVFHPDNASFVFTPVDVVIGGLSNAAVLGGVRLSQVIYGALVRDNGDIQRVFNGSIQAGVLGNTSTYAELEVYVLGGRAFLRGNNGLGWVVLSQDNLFVGSEVFAVGLVHREASAVDAPVFKALAIAEESPTGAFPLTSTVSFLITAEEAPTGSLPLSHLIGNKVGNAFAIPARGALPLSSVLKPSITRLFSAVGALGLTTSLSPRVAVASELRISKQEFFAGNRKGASGTMVISKGYIEAGDTEDAPSFALSGASLTVNPPALASSGLTGGIGGTDYEMVEHELFAADYNYAAAELTLRRPFMFAGGFAGVSSNASNLDFMTLFGGVVANAALFVSFDGDMGVSGDASVLVIMDAQLESALGLGDEITFTSVLKAAIEDGLFLKDGQEHQAPAQLQYVYNLLSGAVSRFEGFSFKGMVTTSAGTFGYTDEGVHKIVDTPEEPISALADFGQIMFGTTRGKRVETVFMGLRADGEVFLSLDDGAREHTYRVITREPTMRAKPGRGMTGREWGVKLELLDVTRAQLDDVEFVVATSARRWTR